MIPYIQDVMIKCPQCETDHIDEGEWYDKPHKTHQCQKCGHEWKPYDFYTRGVKHNGLYIPLGQGEADRAGLCLTPVQFTCTWCDETTLMKKYDPDFRVFHVSVKKQQLYCPTDPEIKDQICEKCFGFLITVRNQKMLISKHPAHAKKVSDMVRCLEEEKPDETA